MTKPTTTPESANRFLVDAISAAKTAIDAVVEASAVDGAVTKVTAGSFANDVNELIAGLQSAKAIHTKMLRVVSSNNSRAKRNEKIARALALLEETENADIV